MKIQTWIMSTTHIDKQWERMAKSALDDMALQINTKYIPQLIEHDWDRQVWIVLYAEVFQLNDWEYALWWVIGIFENEKEKEEFIVWSENIVTNKYKSFLNINNLIDLVDNNKKNSEDNKNTVEEQNTEYWDLLRKYLNSTNVTPDGIVYKTKWYIWGFWSTDIVLYPKDHDNPAHFHVTSKQHNLNARFDLYTYEFISTKHWKITNKLKKQVKQFLLDNPKIVEKLMSEYERMR